MSGANTWLIDFAANAERTDRFAGSPAHAAILAVGLMGEAGSVLAEVKKERRERDAYPAYRCQMLEEIGDFLWYYVRLVSVTHPGLLHELGTTTSTEEAGVNASALTLFLRFGAGVGELLAVISKGVNPDDAEMRVHLQRVWHLLAAVAHEAHVQLQNAAERNTLKTMSRWPRQRDYFPLFDDRFPEEEQLPRHLEIEFTERSRGEAKAVVLRCNGINLGDRLTDNIEDPDGYRYHDVFHFAYAVHLGWSPVVRSLLRCKRKSSSKIDEAQDGARAVILEEAASAIVFNCAKQLNFFDGIDHVDFDLLKTVREFVRGYEVERVPLWQWEAAILDGYGVFRKLRSNRGGRAILDLARRELSYVVQ